MVRRWILKVTAFFLVGTLLLTSLAPITAQDLPEQYENKTKEIQELEQKLSALSLQKKTLANQIANFNAQIRLTELQVEQTEVEITDLSSKIGSLEVSIVGLSEAYHERVITSYRLNRLGNAFLYLLTSQDLGSLFSRLHYLRLIQFQDQELLVRLQTSQVNLEQEREELEALEQKLIEQTAFLSRQRGAKGRLLEVTQNDEKKFQELLAAAKADLESIERALSAVGARIGDVGKGEIIASAGNTGCSTGPHLHFEVFENAKVEGGKVVGDRVNPHQFLDNDTFTHPLPGSIITTEYEEPYILGIHTGIDFAYKYEDRITLGAPIFAAEGGVAYLAQDTEACYLTDTVGKGIIVDHQNGRVTLYWHIP